MADIQDVMAAERDVDDAERALQSYMGMVEDGERSAEPSMVIGLAAVAVVAAIRAVGTRMDYVMRDEGRRG